ncbi:MAG: DUF952 domain-containing protein [Pseudomonadota bacterium]
MLVFKIFRQSEWNDFATVGTTRGAAIDLSDGYIHLSTSTQVAETAEKHFGGAEDLILLAFDPDALGAALRWEKSRGGQDFPHLYRSLSIDEVIWTSPLPLDDVGRHIFPAKAK